MSKKVTLSLFLMAFSLSTFLSIAGIIPLIAEYFSVPITMASLFVALFALILSVTGLFLPSYFSKYERKRFFIISLLVFILSSFLQIFIDNFYLALLIRLIPAFFYSSAISIALTVMGELNPDSVNKIVLGVSAGSILGLSISTQVGVTFGYPFVNVWLFMVNVLALVGIWLLLPEMEGHPSNPIENFSFAKEKRFLVSLLFTIFIGVAISMIYNYFSTVLAVLTKVPVDSISTFLFANGIAAVCGTSLFGYFINKWNNLPIAIYPIVFAVVVIFLGLGIEVPGYTFVLLIIFGLLDGSMHTISQYWLSSSIREAPEFANGAYLFINNMNRAVGIFIGGIFVDAGSGLLLLITSVVCFILACPTAVYRIRNFPNLR
ncbi:MFS transporter [uncultured Methanobrevibacter sp.]|uniref:MFS transporter n=1 Tax=uncultured Methanobrevibacter sp. TaxID=253161 RepID=UPI0025E6C400|nr:MFS transporter [uncultured Methanobrevibacter sp.]